MVLSKSQSPPYASASRISDSECYSAYTDSLKYYDHRPKLIQYLPDIAGLEFNASDKSKCQDYFDVYKECRKKEREARLERNRHRSFFS